MGGTLALVQQSLHDPFGYDCIFPGGCIYHGILHRCRLQVAVRLKHIRMLPLLYVASVINHHP